MLSLAWAWMWPLFAQDPVAKDPSSGAPSRVCLSSSETDGLASVRKLLLCPPSQLLLLHLLVLPNSLICLLMRGCREKLNFAGRVSIELRRVFSIFHCLLIPQCQCQTQSQAQREDISMCQFISTIWFLTSRSACVQPVNLGYIQKTMWCGLESFKPLTLTWAMSTRPLLLKKMFHCHHWCTVSLSKHLHYSIQSSLGPLQDARAEE